MGRPKEYKCKNCNFKGDGPGNLGRHYKENPDHRPASHHKYPTAAKPIVKAKSKANGYRKEEANTLSALGQVIQLKRQFEREIKVEQAEIALLKLQLERHMLHVSELQGALSAISKVEAESKRPGVIDSHFPEIDEPVRLSEG